MRFRKLLFWIHFGAGCTTGLVVLIMSVTGLLLAYQRQIVAWADRGQWGAVQAGTPRLSLETLLAKAGAAKAGNPTALLVRSDPAMPVELTYAPGEVTFVDPYTGAVLGEGSQPVRAFFRTMTSWHRYLGADGENRAVGRAITGASNLAFLVLVATGIYLWWPKSLSWQRLRIAVTFRRQPTGKARDWNWHTVSGFWTAVPLFFIVISAVVISYVWAGDLLYYVTGNEPPQRPAAAAGERPGQPGPGGNQRPGAVRAGQNQSLAGLDALWAKAESKEADWRSITFRPPARPGGEAVFAIDRGNGGQPHLRSTLTLDWKMGEEVRWQTFSSNNAGAQLRQWMRWTHTGEVGGLLGQTIGALACAAGTLLVITGFALAFRRIAGWRRVRAPSAVHAGPERARTERQREPALTD
jgi:uncharacterized iron-regulated membrane protein